MRILIEVRGGVVENVVVEGSEARVITVDHDDLEAYGGSRHARDELQESLMGIPVTATNVQALDEQLSAIRAAYDSRLNPLDLAQAIKREILEAVIAGDLPRTIKSYSELHDYCDANMLGGVEQLCQDYDVQIVSPYFAKAQGLVASQLAAGWLQTQLTVLGKEEVARG